jgi:hypothetical protein
MTELTLSLMPPSLETASPSPRDVLHRRQIAEERAWLWLTGHTPQTAREARDPRFVQNVCWVRMCIEHPGAQPHSRDQARRRLKPFLADGLYRRVGLTLAADLIPIYAALVRSGVDPPSDVGFCVDCLTIFQPTHARAKRCPACSRSPRPRVTPADGDLAAWAEPTFDDMGERRGWTRRYARQCASCQRPFIASDRRIKHCANHARSAGRARRCRESASLYGRQKFRFAWMGEHPLRRLRMRLADGEEVELLISDGGRTVETRDAEVKTRLEQTYVAWGELRRL